MTEMLERQMQHDVWATERLVAHVRKLSPAQLELTTPGTYGTIRRTLTHIVSSDEGYLVRLLGGPFHEPPFTADTDADLDEIARHLVHVKDGIGRLFASGPFEPRRVIPDTPLRRPGAPRFEMMAWAPAAQLIYHGVDHRSQIDTILSTHGLETLDLQIWPYAMELGASREMK
jgi:uncharacterized damage-inducible protein DinB